METYFDVETFVNELKSFPKTNKELVDLIYNDIVKTLIEGKQKEIERLNIEITNLENNLDNLESKLEYSRNKVWDLQEKNSQLEDQLKDNSKVKVVMVAR